MAPVFFAFAFDGQDLPALLSRLTEKAEVCVAACQSLEGRVFLGRSDARPLRVTMQAARVENGRKRIEYGAADYIMTPHGSLAPASVLYRSIDGGTLVAENRFRYTAFRKFSAATEAQFTDLPEVK